MRRTITFGGTTYQWCEYPATGRYAEQLCGLEHQRQLDRHRGQRRQAPGGARDSAHDDGHAQPGRTGRVGEDRYRRGRFGAAGIARPHPRRAGAWHGVEGRFHRVLEQGHAFGGTTYQWCEYPTTSDTPNSCTAWSTSGTYTPTADNVGKRLAVKVIPRTTSGTPTEGAEAMSAKTAAVAWAPPVCGREDILAIRIRARGSRAGSRCMTTARSRPLRQRAHHAREHRRPAGRPGESQGVSHTLHNRTGGGDDNHDQGVQGPGDRGRATRGVGLCGIRDAGTGFTGQREAWSLSFQGPAPLPPKAPAPLGGAYHIRFVQTASTAAA
jgi:hypothetical protein